MTEAGDFNSALRENAVDISVGAGMIIQAPAEATDFIFDFSRDDIQSFERVGDDLILLLNDGSSAQIIDYYASVYENALVFQDTLPATVSSSGLLLGGGGLAALGAAGLALGGGDGDDGGGGGGGGGGATGATVAITGTPGGIDGMVNGAERGVGQTVNGTAEPGSTVQVTIRNKIYNTTADANGDWSVDLAPNALPTGEQDILVNASATDPSGRVTVTTGTITVDTIVNELVVDTYPGGSDQRLNASEIGTAVTVDGTVEPGSTVVLKFNGNTYNATVDATGNWSVDIPAGDIPTSNGASFGYSVTATDAAGNVRTLNDRFTIDTQAPELPDVNRLVSTKTGVEGLETTEVTDGTVEFHKTDGTGGTTLVSQSVPPVDDGAGNTEYSLAEAVDDLILSVSDTSGNTTSVYFVFDDGGANVLTDMADPGLGALNVHAVDMTWEQVDLVLTEASVLALADNTDKLIVYGDNDDSVTMSGAQLQGNVTDGNGDTFYEYTLGNATIWVDDQMPIGNVVT